MSEVILKMNQRLRSGSGEGFWFQAGLRFKTFHMIERGLKKKIK